MIRSSRLTAGIALASFTLAIVAMSVLREQSPLTAQLSGSCKITFKKSADYYDKLGIDVNGLVVEDFNKDGRPDIVTDAGILVGQANGTFTDGGRFPPKALVYATGGNSNIVSGDLNNDGFLDLVGPTAPDLTVRLGQAGGQFGAAQGFPLLPPGTPSLSPQNFNPKAIAAAVALADFNNDGNLDVAAGADYGIYVLLGNGDGTLKSPLRLRFKEMAVRYIDTADLNGDGTPDIVVSGYYMTFDPAFGYTSYGFESWLSKGDGTFSKGWEVKNILSLRFGLEDMNGDGTIDLVFPGKVSSTPGGPDSGISWMSGNGDGSFGASTAVPYTVSNASMPLVADFNADGNPDAAVSAQNNFLTWTGKTPGSFSTQGAPSTTSFVDPNGMFPYGKDIASADFNGDGQLDIALVRHSIATHPHPGGADFLRQGTLTVFLNEGNCGSAPIAGSSPSAPSPTCSVSSDCPIGTCPGGQTYQRYSCVANQCIAINYLVNPCGTANVPTATSSSQSAAGNSCTVRALNFTKKAEYPYAATQPYLATTDIDGDGKMDVITNRIVYLGNGDGTLRAQTAFTDVTDVGAPGSSSTALKDLNKDGKLDLLFGSFSGIGVKLGTGNGTFGAAKTFSALPKPGIAVFTVADFNTDGKLDVAGGGRSVSWFDGISVFLGNGDGTLDAPVSQMGAAQDMGTIANADVNADGKVDLLVAGAAGGEVWLGNGDGTFTKKSTFLAVATVAQIVPIDLTRDGKIDLVIVGGDSPGMGANGGFLLLAAGKGDGTFDQPTPLVPPVGLHWNRSAVIRDFSGDGLLDIVTGGQWLQGFMGNADGTFMPPPPASHFDEFITDMPSSPPGDMASADLNGDGVPDIVLVSGSSVSVFLNATACISSPGSSQTAGAGSAATSAPFTLGAGGSSAVSGNASSAAASTTTGISPSVCKPLCGDGLIVKGKEECDDGNTKSSDGCSSSCKVEPNYQCAP